MDLAEYKAKELFDKMCIPIVKGIIVESIDELVGIDIEYPVVVKAQVHTGGRGKRGGVKFAENFNELASVVKEMLGISINGFTVNKVLVVHKIEIEKEFYLSVMLDRNTKSFLMLFSTVGGMDIEQTAKNNPEKIIKLHIDPLLGLQLTDIRYLIDKSGISDDLSKPFYDMVSNIYNLCVNFHCMLVEINPLVISNGKLVALDAKISVDDSAVCKFQELIEYEKSLIKHELVKEASLFNFLYIPCEPDGNTVVMSNGSGMLMTCIDELTANSIKVSAVLDMGGGAVQSRIKEAVRILLKTDNSEMLFINIFGGITRCDEVAEGIRDAIYQFEIEKPIVVRLEGTNKEKGLSILKELNSVICVDNLKDGIDAVRAEVYNEHTY